MLFDVEEVDGLTVIQPTSARLDSAIARRFKDGVAGLMDEGRRRILIDLADVEFIDSSGLGALVGLLKHAGNSCELELSGLNNNLKKVFALTRMTSVFRIRESAP